MADPAANVNDQPQQQDVPDGGDNNDQPQQQNAPDGKDNNEQQPQQEIANGGADYTRYDTVEEQEITLDKMSESAPHFLRTHATGKRHLILWDRRVRTQEFSVGSVKFKIRAREAHRPNLLRMTNAFAEPNQVEAAGFSTVAEVVLWRCKKDAGQKILVKGIVSAESSSHCRLTSSSDPCPPLDDADAFTITVGAQQFVVSAFCLQTASPVFRTMLNVCDKAERKVTLNDDDPEAFRAFLAAITPGNRVLPNPQNVRGLLKLAEKYQVDFVKEQCAQHLVNCVEIPLLERLVMADQCGLDFLKNYILLYSPKMLRTFYRANCAELRSRISRQLLDELVLRAMANDDDDD